MAIKKTLVKLGSRFAFEFLLETMHDAMIQGLKKYLVPIKAEDIPGMVRESRFPSLENLDFSDVGGNIEHIEKVSLVRLVEFIAEARPDLVEAIQNTGDAGAEYLAKLRQHILDRIKHAEFKPVDTVMATCDLCAKSWPVAKEKIASLKETDCPFCHGVGGGKKEEKQLPAEEE